MLTLLVHGVTHPLKPMRRVGRSAQWLLSSRGRCVGHLYQYIDGDYREYSESIHMKEYLPMVDRPIPYHCYPISVSQGSTVVYIFDNLDLIMY